MVHISLVPTLVLIVLYVSTYYYYYYYYYYLRGYNSFHFCTVGRHIFRLHSVFEFSSFFRSHYEERSLGDVTTTQILSLRGPDLRTVMELHTGQVVAHYENTCTER